MIAFHAEHVDVAQGETPAHFFLGSCLSLKVYIRVSVRRRGRLLLVIHQAIE